MPEILQDEAANGKLHLNTKYIDFALRRVVKSDGRFEQIGDRRNAQVLKQ
jgi:hypothetical protein